MHSTTHTGVDAAVNIRAWDSIASRDQTHGQPQDPPPDIAWTPWPGRGPGAELLGDLVGKSVAEMGCGTGEHVGYTALHGARLAIGIDASLRRLTQARARFGHLPATDWHLGDAAAVLTTLPILDVCYSIFGALWYADPAQLLPAVAGRLRAGGRLVFSVNAPRQGELSGRRVDNLTSTGGARLPVIHYAFDAADWSALLVAHGFRPVEVQPVSGPHTSPHHTLVVSARRAPLSAGPGPLGRPTRESMPPMVERRSAAG
ncbi:class I SAM-dependent methyltransferase [Streptomyces sp. NPDC053474]|uniref:class I SAM-dependent methyltransferase n=1 Tax=Streptomyces sp. NPDC053474 TaxID=3365704 RepID=UPI0037D1D105